MLINTEKKDMLSDYLCCVLPTVNRVFRSCRPTGGAPVEMQLSCSITMTQAGDIHLGGQRYLHCKSIKINRKESQLLYSYQEEFFLTLSKVRKSAWPLSHQGCKTALNAVNFEVLHVSLHMFSVSWLLTHEKLVSALFKHASYKDVTQLVVRRSILSATISTNLLFAFRHVSITCSLTDIPHVES